MSIKRILPKKSPATLAQRTGQAAEECAYQYLKKHGLILITRNYRCRMGEIDLIMQDNKHLVFVEVRFRKNTRFGTSSETVTYFKQTKLRRAASFYLQQQKLTDKIACRFDVIAITQAPSQPTIDWIKNAF